MKILLVTTPIRPKPTNFPPFAVLTLMQHLRRKGITDVEFYNIDGNRPDYEDVLRYIKEIKPDILGISAVVSTAYEYSKRLSSDVKRICPDTFIVLGGNMGASANILLTRTGVDAVVIGEGEVIFHNLVERAKTTRHPSDFCDIEGLAVLDNSGKMINTGYQDQLPAGEIYDLNWDDLEASSDVDLYFPVAHHQDSLSDHLEQDPRFKEPQRIGKRIGTLYTSKGCVSRCTFCHRWDKGIRFIPVPIVMKRLDEIIDRYNVGFLHTADENFGTNKRWLTEFCQEIKKRDVLWRVGTRAKGMTPDVIEMMRDAGCTSIIFGNETGSERMLEIMEKKVTIEENYNAVKWTIEAGVGTKVQLVLGMPGEDPDTVKETIDFCKFTNVIQARQNPNDLSINYAQALPGTPLYEFARFRGMIGKDDDGEEEYLLSISDRDAHDEYTTLNFTDYPKLLCETWRPRITVEVNYHYVKTFGIEQYNKVMARDTHYFSRGQNESGYFANPRRLIETATGGKKDLDKPVVPPLFTLLLKAKWGLALISHPVMAYRARHFLIFLVIIKNMRGKGLRPTLEMIGEYLVFQFKRLKDHGKFKFEYKSLRKIMNIDVGALPGDTTTMEELRKGR